MAAVVMLRTVFHANGVGLVKPIADLLAFHVKGKEFRVRPLLPFQDGLIARSCRNEKYARFRRPG